MKQEILKVFDAAIELVIAALSLKSMTENENYKELGKKLREIQIEIHEVLK